MAFSASSKGCGAECYGTVLGEDPAGWHHYALVWNYDIADASFEGSPLAVYIDGVKRYEAD